MSIAGTPLLFLPGCDPIHTPPVPVEARREAGFLLGELQGGELLSMPHSRQMPSIGPRCHELRIRAENTIWRVVYLIDRTVILIVHVFKRKTEKSPPQVITLCRRRLALYDQDQPDEENDDDE